MLRLCLRPGIRSAPSTHRNAGLLSIFHNQRVALSSQAFEIRVGLIGHVSVGKSTGINAILQEKFSEVSMKRTTAGVNLFRISSGKAMKSVKLVSSTGHESPYVKASDTLKETTADNARLRTSNELQEKVFDIELDEPLLKDMRSDTRLVLIDIPGINEAGTQNIYLDYVSSNWDSFDAMIVVMDAKQGVNTDEQVNLLNFVKKNLDSKKEVPVVVVCNKVDDPDDDEVMGLVKEAQREVENIFAVGDRPKALGALLGGRKKRGKYLRSGIDGAKFSPAFLPTSFENAFLYRSAHGLAASELKCLDKAYIDKIGREEKGKFEWKSLSDERKYEVVHQIVSDPAQYKERLEASNFHKLLGALQYFLGGKKTQEKLIEKQIDVALAKMSSKCKGGELFTDQLISVFDRSMALGKDTSDLAPKFWLLYDELNADAISHLLSNPMNVNALHMPMKELIKYAQDLQNKLAQCHPSIAEDENNAKIVEAMKDLIKQQVAIISEKASDWTPDCKSNEAPRYLNYWEWNGSEWYNEHVQDKFLHLPENVHPADRVESSWAYDPETKKWKNEHSKKELDGVENENPAFLSLPPLSSWADMSPKDWSTVIGSIMLLSSRNVFCDTFGQEIIDLEWMARHAKFSSSSGSDLRVYHEYEEGRYIDGVFTPKSVAKYNRAVQIKVPDSPSDPSHWGHLAWLFCEYMESVEA